MDAPVQYYYVSEIIQAGNNKYTISLTCGILKKKRWMNKKQKIIEVDNRSTWKGSKTGKGGYLYGDSWKLDFWW